MTLPARPKSGNSDKYLKLEPDSAVEGVIAGDPSFFYRRYNEGKYEYSQEPGEGYSQRFQINFIVKHPDGRLEPKIFEGSARFYDELQFFGETFNVYKTWIQIKRTGAKKDTRWSFMPLPEHKVTDEEYEVVKQAELHSLRGEAGMGFGDADTESDAP